MTATQTRAAGRRQQLGNDLLRAAARLTRWASRHASFEVPIGQARLLALVDEIGPARVSALADADHSSQPSMTTAVQRLESLGFAQRVPDPADARASLISLSPTGRTALAHLRQARVAVLSPVLDALDERDLARLRDAVEVIDELLARATPPHPATPHVASSAAAPSTRHLRKER